MKALSLAHHLMITWFITPLMLFCTLSARVPVPQKPRPVQNSPKKAVPAAPKPVAPKPAPQPAVQPVAKKMTILLYMVTDEHTESYMKFNGAQLEREGAAADLNMLLFLNIQRSNGTKITSQMRLQGNKAVAHKTAQNNDESELATFTRALAWAASFQTERYGVILWDHISPRNPKTFLGTYYRGRPRVLVNPSSRTFLTDSDLEQAFKSLTETQLKKQLDFIGLDTCLSTRLDILAAVQPYTQRIIASNQITSLGGWPYHLLLTAFKQGATTGPALAKQIALAYKDYYDPLEKGYSLSVFDAQKLGEVFSNARQIADTMVELLTKQKGTTVTNAFYYSIMSTPRAYQQLPYVDLGAWYKQLYEQAHTYSCENSEDTHVLNARLRNLLTKGIHLIAQTVFNVKGPKAVSASILAYLPADKEKETEAHLQSVWSERFHWQSLLNTYLGL